MNPTDRRKYLTVFAQQMQQKKELTEPQFEYLANVFAKISAGEDANEVLGLKYQRGNGPTKDKTRQKLSLVLQWIACATESTTDDGLGYTLEEACNKAVPFARGIFGDKDSQKYDVEYLKKCWYKSDYAHMRSPTRGHFDKDSPF